MAKSQSNNSSQQKGSHVWIMVLKLSWRYSFKFEMYLYCCQYQFKKKNSKNRQKADIMSLFWELLSPAPTSHPIPVERLIFQLGLSQPTIYSALVIPFQGVPVLYMVWWTFPSRLIRFPEMSSFLLLFFLRKEILLCFIFVHVHFIFAISKKCIFLFLITTKHGRS